MKKLLIIGGNSFISNVFDVFSNDYFKIFKTTRRYEFLNNSTFYLDLDNPNSFQNILNENYDFIFLLSGMTNLNLCQNNRDSYFTNVISLKKLIKFISNHLSSKIYFFSSSAVFSKNTINRNEKSLLCPDTHYGEHKAEIENYISEISNAFVIRLTKLISKKSDIMDMYFNKNLKNIYSNVSICPISSAYIYNSIIKILNSNCNEKVIHLNNLSEISYVTFFNNLNKKFNLDTKRAKLIEYNGISCNHILENVYTKNNYNINPESISDFYSNLINYEI